MLNWSPWDNGVANSSGGTAVTVRLPVGAVQLTENDVDAVPPAGTLTVRDGPPLTEQLLATPDSTTVWLAAESPVNVTLPFVPIDLLAFPSTVTV